LGIFLCFSPSRFLLQNLSKKFPGLSCRCGISPRPAFTEVPEGIGLSGFHLPGPIAGKAFAEVINAPLQAFLKVFPLCSFYEFQKTIDIPDPLVIESQTMEQIFIRAKRERIGDDPE
jgi:hypothetical protein